MKMYEDILTSSETYNITISTVWRSKYCLLDCLNVSSEKCLYYQKKSGDSLKSPHLYRRMSVSCEVEMTKKRDFYSAIHINKIVSNKMYHFRCLFNLGPFYDIILYACHNPFLL